MKLPIVSGKETTRALSNNEIDRRTLKTILYVAEIPVEEFVKLL